MNITRMSAPSDGEPPVSDLITVAQAIKIIDQTPVEPRVAQVSVTESAGLRLAADILCDRDYPPFRKALMDGYAVRCEDVTQPPTELECVAEVAAGQTPNRTVNSGEAIAIMTGAPMPAGADGVVPVEDVETRARVGEKVRVLRAATPGRYIALPGSDGGKGQVVLTRGTLIGPPQIAVAASVGATQLGVFARPRVAVLGTGSELIPADANPTESQIRNSNNPMLVAQLRRSGCDVTDLGFVRDDPNLIREAIQRGFSFDALFITGGMSMGEYDYVPRLLLELGTDLKITKLRIKPGKPFVFGVGKGSVSALGAPTGGISSSPQGPASEGTGGTFALSPQSVPSQSLNPEPRTLNPPFIFGLPGNPVSAFVCTLRLASRLLARMAGGVVEERWVTGRVEAGLLANGPREFYQPVIRTVAPGTTSLRSGFASIVPLNWKGSADLFTLARANAMLVRGENEPPVPKGTVVRVLEI
jgi:molybdopterin molybdotransferase